MNAGRVDAREITAALRGERFVQLAAALGGKFRRRMGAKTLRMPCFLHGGSDLNLALTPSEGLWHCHSTCGGGDAIEMVELARGLDFQAALAWLSEWLGAPASRPMLALVPPAPKKPAVSTAPLMREIWRIVAAEPLTHRAIAYLLGRGIDPDAAIVTGCRDWAPKRAELGALFGQTAPEVLEAAGFGAKLGWAPLSNAPAPEWGGLAVPSWGLDEDLPSRWRWRLYDAPEGEPKSRSPIGGGADILGFGRPLGERLEGSSLRLPRAPDTLLIVEGEPDWLSCVEAVDGRALVVAVCGGSTIWRDTWPAWGDIRDLGIRRVVVAVHRGKIMAPCTACGRAIEASAHRCRFCAAANDSARTDGIGHGEAFAADVAACAAAAGVSAARRLPAEDNDLNDKHRRGELAQWLRDTLERPALKAAA